MSLKSPRLCNCPAIEVADARIIARVNLPNEFIGLRAGHPRRIDAALVHPSICKFSDRVIIRVVPYAPSVPGISHRSGDGISKDFVRSCVSLQNFDTPQGMK